MNWEKRSAKQGAREVLLSQLWFDRPISYMGLPAGRALFEKQLIRRGPVKSMLLFERDKGIFQELHVACRTDEELSSIDRTVLPMDVDRWMTSAGRSMELPCHDLTWLDYCGPVTTERLSHVGSLALGMRSDGIFAVTFMVGREKVDVDQPSLVELDTEMLSLAQLKRVRTVLNAVDLKENNFKVTIQPYADGVPMLLMIFKKSLKVGDSYQPLSRTVVDIRKTLKGIRPRRRGRPLKVVMIDGDRYSSADEAAQQIGCAAQTVRNRARSSSFPGYKYI
tara:strand:+ start:1553 stop:2389 length:837 start_codon:yes stop_codon:yes gene_type:complete